MLIWLLELHNLVNVRLEKASYSREKIKQMYHAVYTLTKEQIEEDRNNAMSSSTMRRLWQVDFSATNDYKGEKYQKELPGLDLDPSTWGYGFWVALFFDALRSRTKKTATNFIKRNIPLLVGTLSDSCNTNMFKFIYSNHPAQYLTSGAFGQYAMFKWVIQLHNFVNTKLGKPQYPEARVREMFAPLYDLTDDQISSDREAAMDPEMMEKINLISFVPDGPEGSPDEGQEAADESQYIRTRVPVIMNADTKKTSKLIKARGGT